MAEEEQKKKKKPDPIDDEEEETYMYDVRRKAEFINEGANGVFDIKMQTGINTKKSIFDRSSVFNG